MLVSFGDEKQALVGRDLSYHKAGVSSGSQDLLLKITYTSLLLYREGQLKNGCLQ